jgi:hypothetical protein
VLCDVRDVEERRRIFLEMIGLDEQRLWLAADDVGNPCTASSGGLARRSFRRRRRRHADRRTALRGAHRMA